MSWIRHLLWAIVGMSLTIALGFSRMVWAEDVPLQRWVPDVTLTANSPTPMGWDGQLWGRVPGSDVRTEGDRRALITAIDHSLQYLQTPEAEAAYQDYPIPEITRDRVQRSLEHFRDLLLTCQSPEELQTAVLRDFDFYRSVGQDGNGSVSFTGYFEPIYAASPVPTAEYRYPLYRLPPNLPQWQEPHPTRLQLEGSDGLQGSQGPLRGLELVWLRDRLEAFLVQVQGSARLQFPDGRTMSVGYAGRTSYPYTSLGRELVNDGRFTLEELTLPMVLQYFRDHPDDLDRYLPRNQRFIFFRETAGGPPVGSLRVPVTPERSIATDKTLMPPGAIALIQTDIPYTNHAGQLEAYPVSRYVLDQDTGGAIQGAGRVDIFMGTGSQAGDRAGLMHGTGFLTYLLLKS